MHESHPATAHILKTNITLKTHQIQAILSCIIPKHAHTFIRYPLSLRYTPQKTLQKLLRNVVLPRFVHVEKKKLQGVGHNIDEPMRKRI